MSFVGKSGKYFECNVCHYKTVSNDRYLRHMADSHPIVGKVRTNTSKDKSALNGSTNGYNLRPNGHKTSEQLVESPQKPSSDDTKTLSPNETISECDLKFKTEYSKSFLDFVTTFNTKKRSYTDSMRSSTDLSANESQESDSSDDKRVVCEWKGCFKTFASTGNMRNHMRQYHLKETRFTCDHHNCFKSFLHFNQLLAHRNTHSKNH